MSGNSVTGAIVRNKVVFDIDNNSYQKVLTRVRSLQAKITKSVSAARGGIATKTGKTFGSQPHIIAYQKQMQLLEKSHTRTLALNKAFNLKQANAIQQQGKLHSAATRLDSQRTNKIEHDLRRKGVLHAQAVKMNAVFDQKAAQRRAKMSGDEELRTDRGSNRLMAGFSATKDLRLQKGQRSALRAEMYRLNSEYRRGNLTLQSYNQKLTKQISLAKRQSAILAARKTTKLNKTTEVMNTNLLGGTAGRMVGGLSRAAMIGGGAVGAVAGGVGTVVAAYGVLASASIAAARGIVSYSAEITKSKMAMAATFNKSELPDAESYVYTEAMRLGTTLAEVSTSYADLYYSGKSAGMSNKEIKDLNSGMLNYGAVMSKTGYELSFVTKGLTQMLSKGSQISKEELDFRLTL